MRQLPALPAARFGSKSPSILKFGELVRDMLPPPAVLNIVTGGDALGPWRTKHPGFGVRKKTMPVAAA